MAGKPAGGARGFGRPLAGTRTRWRGQRRGSGHAWLGTRRRLRAATGLPDGPARSAGSVRRLPPATPRQIRARRPWPARRLWPRRLRAPWPAAGAVGRKEKARTTHLKRDGVEPGGGKAAVEKTFIRARLPRRAVPGPAGWPPARPPANRRPTRHPSQRRQPTGGRQQRSEPSDATPAGPTTRRGEGGRRRGEQGPRRPCSTVGPGREVLVHRRAARPNGREARGRSGCGARASQRRRRTAGSAVGIACTAETEATGRGSGGEQ